MSRPASPKLYDTTVTRRTCDPTLHLRIPHGDAEMLANVFKALSHPVRLQIIDLIGQGKGEVCGCDIERHFDLSQPTISHHMKVLRDAGLIVSEASSVWVHHKINTRLIGQLHDYLHMITASEEV